MASQQETSETFTLELSKILKGPPRPALACKFTYHWNFATSEGQASLLQINDTEISGGITLYPLGIVGQVDFMSNIQPTQITLRDGTVITLYRVILKLIGPKTKKASLMLGETGDSIIATENWEED